MYTKKYKCLVRYSMVYHSKATDGARLAEMVGLPQMFGKLSSTSPEVTIDVFSPNWSGVRTHFVHASTIVSYGSTDLHLRE